MLKGDGKDVFSNLDNIKIFNLYLGYKILLFPLSNVYFSQVVVFNEAASGRNLRDMEAVDVKFQMGIGCIRVVFLNKFVMNLLVRVSD